jgi:uncharacterized membrane protein
MDPQSTAGSFPPATSPAAAWPRSPRMLAPGRGVQWWSEGWRIFTAAPLVWIGMLVVLVLIMGVINFVPVLGPLAQALLWPVFSGGMFLGCRELAQGRPLAFTQLFAAFKDGRAGGLIILGLIALVVGVVLSLIIALFVFGALGMSGMMAMMKGDPSIAMSTAIAGAGVAALIATPLVFVAGVLFMMAWWLAVPLVVLYRAQPIEALKASFDASWKNLGALALCVLIFIVAAIVATIPFGLGWLVLMPVAVGTNFAAWREIFGD